jgi:hypothetical protein
LLTVDGRAPAPSFASTGTWCALVGTCLLSLAGFFLVRGGILHDRRTSLGDVLLGSGLSPRQYLLAHWFASSLLLGGLALAIGAGGLTMPATSQGHRVIQIFLPVGLLALPAVASVAALALTFDSIPPLAGAAGNAIFLGVWLFLLASSFSGTRGDLMGLGTVTSSLQAQSHGDGVHATGNVSLVVDVPKQHSTYAWDGVSWTWHLIAQRLAWLMLATLIPILLAPAYVATGGLGSRREHALTSRRSLASAPPQSPPLASLPPAPHATNLFLVPLRAELLLLWRDMRWWHLLALAVSIIIGLRRTPFISMHTVLPLAWLWPVGLLGSLGSREQRRRVRPMLLSPARRTRYRLAASWVAGLLLVAASGSGVLTRVLMEGDVRFAASWLSGALFMASLATGLGRISGTERTWEAVYLLLWYLGPIRGNRWLDFTGGGSPHGTGDATVLAALSLGLLLVLLATADRQWTRARLGPLPPRPSRP